MQSIERRFGTADVGGFRIVDPAHAVVLQHQLETMRQPGECGQRFQAAGTRQTRSVRQSQGRKRVTVVMLAANLHLFDVEHLLAFDAQPGFSLLAVEVIVANVNAEADAAIVSAAYRHG